MQNSDGRTRRQAIQIGVTAASAAVVGSTVAGTAAGASPGASTADFGAVGRVRGVTGGVVELDLLAGPDGAAAQKVVGRASMPLVGFPDSVIPRASDKIAVSRSTPGYEAAALPLTHWVTGIPVAAGDGSFMVAGERTTDAPELRVAAKAGTTVSVCLLDTDLRAAQALHVQPADHS